MSSVKAKHKIKLVREKAIFSLSALFQAQAVDNITPGIKNPLLSPDSGKTQAAIKQTQQKYSENEEENFLPLRISAPYSAITEKYISTVPPTITRALYCHGAYKRFVNRD